MWNALSTSESESESMSVSLESELEPVASLSPKNLPDLIGCCWFFGVSKGLVLVGHLVCLVKELQSLLGFYACQLVWLLYHAS